MRHVVCPDDRKWPQKVWMLQNVLHIRALDFNCKSTIREKPRFPGLLQSPLTDSNR
jgi:hypothetical protein